MHTRNNDELIELLRPLARKHHYAEFKVCFKSTRDLSASWRIRSSSLELLISDYLADAPDDALLEFTESVILMANKKRSTEMPTYIKWVTEDRFIINKRKLFIKRSKNLARDNIGSNYNLMDSVQRLLDLSLICPLDIDNSYFTWTNRPNYRKVGYCSPLVRVVVISNALDSDKVPENVLDYVVFHEILHLRQGYRPFHRSHDSEFRNMEKNYPDRIGCSAFLRELKKKIL